LSGKKKDEHTPRPVSVLEVIDQAQAYIDDPSEPLRKELVTLAKLGEKGLLAEIFSRMARLKEDGMEKALFYNPNAEINRIYQSKEITHDEYLNNPLKKVFEEYAAAVPFRINDLSRPCVLFAVSAAGGASDYQRSTNKAIKQAEKYIKLIHETTACNAEVLTWITSRLVDNVCNTAYDVYHPQEWQEMQECTEKYASQSARVMELIEEPCTDAKNDEIYKERDFLTDEYFARITEREKQVYKADQAQEITAQILGRIFPGLKPAIRPPMSLADKGELDGYIFLPNNAITQFIKQTLNNPQNVAAMKKGLIATQENLITKDISITYLGSDGTTATIELARTKELFKERVRGGAKMFNFFLQKNNEQHGQETTGFLLQELIDIGLYANKDSAYKGIKKITKKMMSMSIEGKQTAYDGTKKKEIRSVRAVLVSQVDVTYTSCSISLPPIIRGNAKYITILPKWGYSLTENGFMLLDYIYYLARQNTKKISTNHYFNVGLEAVRVHLGLPTPERAAANPGRLIIEPIEEAIRDIEDSRNGTDIKITPFYDANYKSVSEFLTGHLQIELDEQAENYMEQIAKRQEKELKRAFKKKEQAELQAQIKREIRDKDQLELS